MQSILRWISRNAVSGALLLTAASAGASAYAVSQVQDQRTATVVRNCQDQNARHDKTIVALDGVLVKALNGPAVPPGDTPRQADIALRRAEAAAPRSRLTSGIVASDTSTVLLINALAPYQNCRQVLAKSTSTK